MKRAYLIFISFLLLTYACGGDGRQDLYAPDLRKAGFDGDFKVVTNQDDRKALSQADTQQINARIELAGQLCFSDPDSARALLMPAIRRSRQIHYNFGLGYAYNVLGVTYFNEDDFKLAHHHFLKALSFFEILEDSSKSPLAVYMNLAHVFVLKHNPDSAFHYYQRSLNFIDRTTDPERYKVFIYNGISLALMLREQHDQAAYYLNKSMTIAKNRMDTNAIASCYGVAGAFYEKINPDSSLLYHQKAHKLYMLLNNKRHVRSSLRGIAKMWVRKEQPDSAQHYFKLAASISFSNSPSDIVKLGDIGNVYYLRGDYQQAMEYYKQAEMLLTDSSSSESFMVIYSNLALIYHHLDQHLLAYQYKVWHANLKDSLFNEQKLAAINQLDVKFRLTEKSRDLLAKQLLIAEQQGKIQRQYLGISLAAVLILLLVIILFRRKHRTTLDRINAKLAGIEQERLRLAQEIHDGIVSKLTSVKMNFNALPDFQEEPVAKHFNETLQHFDDSISELRRTTHNLHPSLLQHVGLFNALNSYVAQINAGGKIQIVTEVQGEFPGLDPDAELHLYRIVQELLQNVIKHSGADRAVIQLFWETEQLRIVISDNGKGREADESAGQKNGIGLHNLRDRIQLLHGTMKQQPTTSGTIIKLSFHLKHLSAKNV